MIKPLTAVFEKQATRWPLLTWLSERYYRSICQKEANVARIVAGTRVLFIGAGAYPFSALYFAKVCQAEVTAVDIDGDKVKKAAKTFGKHLKCLCADGACVNVSSYDVIIVAKQVEPKDMVLNHVFRQAQSHARILVRDGVVPQTIKHKARPACRHTFRLVRRTWLITL